MPELTSSTREAARRIGVTETALRKAATTGRIVREADGQWDVEKTRRRLIETADPVRSPLAGMPVGASMPGSIATGAGTSLGDSTPFARLKVAELALKVEARRLALDEEKARLLDVATANAAIDEIAAPEPDRVFPNTERFGNPRTGPAGQCQQHGLHSVRPATLTRTRQCFQAGSLFVVAEIGDFPVMSLTRQSVHAENRGMGVLVNHPEPA